MPIPIPHRPSGFILGQKDAAVKVDAFVDIQCPHSKRAWPTLMQLLEHYAGQSFSLRVHLITISNHRQAWDMSLALIGYANGNPQEFAKFASFLYEQQARFYNGEFTHKTHQDLKNLAAELANEFSGFDSDKMHAILDDHDVYIDGRTPIRYAATKSVWATPTFFINNADDVPVDHTSSLDDWLNVIDPLLN